MLRPLSLLTSNQQVRGQTYEINSPFHRKRADSLVFSITSEKYGSPKDVNLLQSKQNNVSRQIQTLQLKLDNLESRVERIDSQPYHSNSYVPNGKTTHQSNVFLKTAKNPTQHNKENRDNNISKVGKIVKKDRDLSKTTKFQKINNSKGQIIYPFASHSRNSLNSQQSVLFQKVKEVQKLRRQVSNMKTSLEKNERSKSLCSERLSASKKMIKSLKHQQKKKEKNIQKLRVQLRKSQNIRQKQKQVIQKQQQQLNYYREIFNIHKRLR